MLVHDTESLSEILGSRTKKSSMRKDDLFPGNTIAPERRHETFRPDHTTDSIVVPNVIIPFGGDIDDFFATVATYYQDLSPVSAIAHVLSEETANLLTLGNTRRTAVGLPPISDAQRRVCVGAAIGEAVLAGTGTFDPSTTISYAACRRTLSFCLARTQIIHGSKILPNIVEKRWTKLRKLTGLSVSSAACEAALLTHQLALGTTPPPHFLHFDIRLERALQADALSTPLGQDVLLSAIVHLYPETEAHIGALNGAFDGRLTAFKHLVQAIQAGSMGRHMDEIAVAFFCDRIQPGSFAHAGILATLVDFYPAALVWYGYLCAGRIHAGSNQLNQGLIAKIERDLFNPFSFAERPQCDISLEELEVLSRARLRADSIRPSQQRALLVALLPGLNVYTRFGADTDPAIDKNRTLELEHMHTRVSKLLEEALLALKKSPSTPQLSPPRPRGRSATSRRKDPGK